MADNSTVNIVKNNIFSSSVSVTATGSSSTVRLDAGSVTGFDSDYNDFFSSNSANTGIWGANTCLLGADWTAGGAGCPGSAQDSRSIAQHPQWADPGAGSEDFHPKSTINNGRWNPATGLFDMAADPIDSATIDAADPAEDEDADMGLGAEPSYNGDYANQGSYGRTSQASKSYTPAGVCSMTYQVKKFGGGNYTSIRAAVGAIPTSALSGTYCIVVDSHTYSEQVLVTSRTNNGYLIKIMSDPNMVSTATTINPPAGSTAAFVIQNASVSISGFNIISTNTVPYGVLVSSQFVSLSSVNVIDPGGNIYFAGMALSSWSVVNGSSITVSHADAYGFFLPGSTATTISYSTAVAYLSAVNLDHASFNSVDHGSFSCTGTGNGLHLSGASSNTFTYGYVYAENSHAALVENDASTNTFTNVTLVSNSNGAALYLTDSSSNTLAQCSLSMLGNYYAAMIAGSRTTISRSTITKPGAETTEVMLVNASSVSIVDSVIYGPYAFRAVAADYLAVRRSTITATTTYAMSFNVSHGVIDDCYIQADNNTGLDLTSGNNDNAVSNSTVVAGGSGYAVSLVGAFLNTFTQNLFISSGSGGYGTYLSASSSNTFVRDFFTSPRGQAMYVRDQSNMNVIAQSTMTSSVLRGISFYNVSSNTLTDCYLQGSTAVYVVNSTGTTIGNSTLLATQQGNSALWAFRGNVNLTVASSTLLAPLYPGTTSSVLLLDRLNRGMMNFSSNTIRGGQYGIRVGTQVAGSSLWITSNTVAVSTSDARDTYGIYLNGLKTGATIQNNSIVLRQGGDLTSAYTAYGLYGKSAGQVNFDHNRVSNPGLLTGGSFVGAYLTGTDHMQFKFNDVHSTGTGLTNAYLLWMVNGSTANIVKNNIFSSSASVTVTGSSAAVRLDAGSQTGFDSDYNDFFSSATAGGSVQNTGIWGSATCQLGTNWTGTGCPAAAQDSHSMAANPLWADPGQDVEDFHPRSKAVQGRWSASGWVQDGVYSPTIDKADPSENKDADMGLGVEPADNGAYANLGSYGRTDQASKTWIPTLPAGCPYGTTVKQDYTEAFTGIMDAVNSLNKTLAGPTCVVVKDNGTYNEQVTVQNFTNAGSTITIMADAGVRPVVAPPSGFTAGFVLKNTSAAVLGIDVIPANAGAATSYGVLVSSMYVQVSSINVVDPSGRIKTAGIKLAGWGAVSYASVTVSGASVPGFLLSACTMTSVSYSSATSSGDVNNPTIYVLSAGSNTIHASSFSNTNAVGRAATFSGANYNFISSSTFLAGAPGERAVRFLSASSNTVTGCYVYNSGNGDGLVFSAGGSYNSILRSTIATNDTGGYSALYSGAPGNRISESWISAPNGVALLMNVGSDGAIISFSTMSGNSSANAAAQLSASSCTMTRSVVVNLMGAGLRLNNAYGAVIVQSSIQGSTAVYITASTNAVIGNSVLSAIVSTGAALRLDGGSSGLALSSSTLIGGAQGCGLYLAPNNSGLINASTNAFQGGQYGICIGTQTSAAQVWITSNTVVVSTSDARDTYGIYLNGLKTGATIQNNSIVLRQGGNLTSAYTAYGLYAKSAGQVNFDHNRVSNPGLLTGGSYAAAYLTGTDHTQFKFNDLHSTGTGLTNAYLLWMVNSSTANIVKDNIFSSSMTVTVTGSSATVRLDAGSQTGFASDYNDFFSSATAGGSVQNTGVWGGVSCQLGAGWTGTGCPSQDANSIAQHPQWAGPGVGVEDFHPKSMTANGRYNPATGAFDLAADTIHSATIDAADTAENVGVDLGLGLEPDYAAIALANQGSYGRTAQASMHFGALKEWVGGYDTNWYTGNNWSPIGIPADTDIVRINKNVAVTVSASSPAIVFAGLILGSEAGTYASTITVSTGILATNGWLTIFKNASLLQNSTQTLRISSGTVFPGGLLTHASDVAGSVPTKRVNLSVGGDFDLQAGATIAVDGRGYPGGIGATGSGTGGGIGGVNTPGGGGGHGGYGGHGSVGAGGAAYDSFSNPVDHGSGGGANNYLGFNYVGGNGGGTVILSVSGAMTLNGLISANGNSATAIGDIYAGEGGGAGGSVNVSANTISGSGTVRANGGNGFRGGSSFYGGGGSGGIISLRAASGQVPAAIIAVSSAAAGFSSGGDSLSGAAGPVFSQDAGQTGSVFSLKIAGGSAVAAANTPIPGADLTIDTFSVSNAMVSFASDSNAVFTTSVSVTGTNSISLSKAVFQSAPDFTGANTVTISSAIFQNGSAFSGVNTMSIASATFQNAAVFSGTNTVTFTSATFSAGISIPGGSSNTITYGSLILPAGNLTLPAKTTFIQNSVSQFLVQGDLTMLQGSSWRHAANAAVGTQTSLLNINVTGAFDLQAGATISANGKGYPGGVGVTGWGPGGGGGGVNAGPGGGSHGGYGGQGSTGGGGSVYDSLSNPVNHGSGGGGNNYTGLIGTGGNGGGTVLLTVGGAVTLNGLIAADGDNAVANGSAYNGEGGGAGGAVNIAALSISGSGTVSANGGNGFNGGSSFYGGGGSGGIISLRVTSGAVPPGIITAASAATGAGSGGTSLAGAAGTVFTQDAAQTGSVFSLKVAGGASAAAADTPIAGAGLTIDTFSVSNARVSFASDSNAVFTTSVSVAGANSISLTTATFAPAVNFAGSNTITIASATFQNAAVFSGTNTVIVASATFNAGMSLPGGSSNTITYAHLAILSGGLTVPAKNTFIQNSLSPFSLAGDLTMNQGAAWRHALNAAGNTQTKMLNLNISGDFDLQAGATIAVDGQGYSGGVGTTGAGPDGSGGVGGVNTPGGGGGHGGPGGHGSVGAGRAAYDSLSNPVNHGGGGGANNYLGFNYVGGNGGGTVILSVSGAMTLNGLISANGNSAIAIGGIYAGEGGGAGGSVNIAANTLSGSGAVRANGGNGFNGGSSFYGGGGGGGRIALAQTTCSSSLSIWASSGPSSGGDSVAGSTGAWYPYPSSFQGEAQGVSSITWSWGAACNASTYDVLAATDNAVRAGGVGALTWDEVGLSTNALYGRQVRGFNGTTAFPTVLSPSASFYTLAAQPGTPPEPFTQVNFTSVTLNWLARGNPGYTEFFVRASTASDFTGDLFYPAGGAAAWMTSVSTAVVGLTQGRLYYFEVRARNVDGFPTGFEVLGSTRTLDTGYPGCVVAVNVGAGQAYATISAGVAALPSTLTGHSCVVIRDGAAYAEQVTVQGFTNGGSSITILADPGSGLRPAVEPLSGSTAAFVIANASVNVFGVDVVAANSMPYGVRVSSEYVALSSVNVVDPGGKIYFAGVQLSSWNTVAWSSMTTIAQYGFYLPGSTMTSISFSSVVYGGTSYPIYLVNARNNSFDTVFSSAGYSGGYGFYAMASNTNTVTRSILWGGMRGAGFNQGYYNEVSLSTMVGKVDTGLYLDNSDSNTVTQCFMWGKENGAYLAGGADRNSVSYSTLSATATGLLFVGADYNDVTQSFIRGGQIGAQVDNGSDRNAISFSTMTGGTMRGLYINASDSNTLTQSYVEGPYGAYLTAGADANAVSISTVVGTSNDGMYVSASDRSALARSVVRGPQCGLRLLSGSDESSIDLSDLQGNGNSGLYADASDSSTVTRSRLSGMLGASLGNGSDNTRLVLSTATSGMQQGVYLWRSSFTRVLDSYLQGTSEAFFHEASTGTTIGGSVLCAQNPNGSALRVTRGSADILLSSTTFIGGAQGYGLFLEANGSGTVAASTNTFLNAQYAVYAATQVPGTSLWLTSNTLSVAVSNARYTYGIYLEGLRTGATIQNNSIILRAGGNLGSYGAYGLYAKSAGQVNFDHNRISNPGLLTGGSFVGAYLTGTDHVQFKFNDLHSTGTGLTNAYLLWMVNSSTVNIVKDNIFSSSVTVTVTGSSATVRLDAGSQSGFVSDYNDFFSSATADGSVQNTGIWGAATCQLGAGWTGTGCPSQDSHSFAAHPFWFDPGCGVEDFHPMSEAANGRWSASGWVSDGETSRTIDKADPAEDEDSDIGLGVESANNGSYANLGSYGLTDQASKSVYEDCGLAYFDGTNNIRVACELSGTVTSKLRLQKTAGTYGVRLVEPDNCNASRIRIRTSSGTKALRLY